MSKVKSNVQRVAISEPSDDLEMVRAAGGGGGVKNKEATTTDSMGRIIKVRRPGPLDRMRLFRIVGAENAKNMQYLEYAAIACAVTQISDIEYTAPQNLLQIEARVQLLDDCGLEAAALALKDLLGIVDNDDPESDMVAAGK